MFNRKLYDHLLRYLCKKMHKEQDTYSLFIAKIKKFTRKQSL